MAAAAASTATTGGATLSVDEVCVWLKTLSLDKYAPAFKAAGVDGPLLMALSEDDLKNDLGTSCVARRSASLFLS